MKTEDLIRALAADAASLEPPPQGRVVVTALGCWLVLVVVVLTTLGLRANLFGVMLTPRVLFKFAVAIAFASGGLAAALRLMHPDASARHALRPLIPAFGLLACGVAAELFATPAASWPTRMLGQNALFCLMIVPLFSAVPLTLLMTLARQGASPAPPLSGAVLGLAAAALAALAYGLHCPDDSPLFVLAWYGAAMVISSLGGALAGRKALRW